MKNLDYNKNCCGTLFLYGIKVYKDPLNERDLIRNENNGKTGVYAWVNNINNKIYIGSGNLLYLRLSDYYQDWYPKKLGNIIGKVKNYMDPPCSPKDHSEYIKPISHKRYSAAVKGLL